MLFIATEDDAEIDLKPRLVAAGAVMSRCFDIPLHVQLPWDIPKIEEFAKSKGGVDLLVIDPLANHSETATRTATRLSETRSQG